MKNTDSEREALMSIWSDFVDSIETEAVLLADGTLVKLPLSPELRRSRKNARARLRAREERDK